MKRYLAAAAAFMFTSCTADTLPEITQVSPVPVSISAECSSRGNISAEKPVSARLNYEEQRAVWISYIDMAQLCADTEEEFTENVSKAFDDIAELGLNTVYVHMRAFGDAYYDSELFVPSAVIPKSNDRIAYDPLEKMTELAHEKKISLHAWINPLRCASAENMEKMRGTKLYEWYSDPKAYPEYISYVGDTGLYWLDPAIPEVRRLVSDGVREICDKYDVDGIHIDDYFYPTTDPSFDKETYADSDTDKSLAEWRLENCSMLVKEIHDTVKDSCNDILFGVSPQGNLDNNYTQMYADVKRWCSRDGYIDYIAPQIYFGYDNSVCPFSQTLSQWVSICTSENVDLVCGLGVYKISDDKEFADDTGVIAQQIADCMADDIDGVALYSFDTLFRKEGTRYENERKSVKMQFSSPKIAKK